MYLNNQSNSNGTIQRQKCVLRRVFDNFDNMVSLLPGRWSEGMKAKNNRKWPKIFLDFLIVNNSANKSNIRKR